MDTRAFACAACYTCCLFLQVMSAALADACLGCLFGRQLCASVVMQLLIAAQQLNIPYRVVCFLPAPRIVFYSVGVCLQTLALHI
jgi:hypothetical protein